MYCNEFGALPTGEIMLNNLCVILNAFVWIVNRELILDRNQEQETFIDSRVWTTSVSTSGAL